MREIDQNGQHHSSSARLRPHAKWAQQLMALSQCQLVGIEREQVEAHLDECPACKQAYLVYCAVSSLIHDKAPPALPPGLPPKLQALKEKVLAEDAAFVKQRATPAAKPRKSVTPQGQAPRASGRAAAAKKPLAKKGKKGASSDKEVASAALPAVVRGKP